MTSRQHTTASGAPGGTARALAAVLIVPLLAGCEHRPDRPRTQPTTRGQEKVALPATVPGMEDENPGAAEVMVKAKYDRGEKETYRHDPDYPFGTLKGGCRFVKTEGKINIPPAYVLDVSGPNAVRDPKPKETAYYSNIEIRPPDALQTPRRRKVIHVIKYGETYIPCNVVLMLRDVKVGRRPPLDRPAMVVRQGIVIPGSDANYAGNDVQFCPLHDRVQFTTWDEFPCELVLTEDATGEAAFETTVRYVQTEDRKLRGRIDVGHLAYKPELLASPPLRRPGLYVLTCRRHPWQRGYLWVVPNPYVTTTVWAVYRNPRCNFQIDCIPPGRHTVEVWHPIYKPVSRTIEVEIKANRIKELLIEFHPPAGPPAGNLKSEISDLRSEISNLKSQISGLGKPATGPVPTSPARR